MLTKVIDELNNITVIVNHNIYEIRDLKRVITSGKIITSRGFHIKIKINNINYHVVVYRKTLFSVEKISIYVHGELVFSNKKWEMLTWEEKSKKIIIKENKSSNNSKKQNYINIVIDSIGSVTILDLIDYLF